jgi:hypothetical protein
MRAIVDAGGVEVPRLHGWQQLDGSERQAYPGALVTLERRGTGQDHVRAFDDTKGWRCVVFDATTISCAAIP